MGFLKVGNGILVAGVVCAWLPAAAENRYLGIGAGNASIDDNVFELSADFNEYADDVDAIPGVDAGVTTDSSDTGVKYFYGYNANEHIALEVGYADLGEFKNTVLIDDDGSATLTPGSADLTETQDISGFYIAAIGRLPVSEWLDISAAAGMYAWDTKSKYVISDTTGQLTETRQSKSDDGEDLYYGVGANIGWFGVFYDVYKVGDADVDFFGIAGSIGL